MNTVVKTKFSVKPVVAAVALAVASVSAYADPTPNQLPGAGLIRAVNTGTTISAPSLTWIVSGGGAVGGEIINGTMAPVFFPGSIQLNNAGTVARAVIRWGGNGASSETYNPQGFNIGSNAAVYFTSSASVTDAAVLNIDASGNASQVFGKLIALGTVGGQSTNPLTVGGSGGGAAPKIFLANANGIVVGAGGEIQIPNGGGLIGYNMDSKNVAAEFVADNGSMGSFLDLYGSMGGTATIVNNGYIYGGAVGLNTNSPAAYVLLVGGDIVNTTSGNIFADNVHALAGMRGYSSTTVSDTVAGVSKTSVQRLFDVTTGALLVGPSECVTGTSCLEVSKSGAAFVNDATISSVGGSIDIYAAKTIRSGTAGSTNPTIGLFFDDSLYTNVYEAGGSTSLYNIVGRYNESSGIYNNFVSINGGSGWDGDVTIQALTRASAPSSITTNFGAYIRGANVAINSTINHLPNGAAFNNLDILSSNSVTVAAAIGAGDHVNILNGGAGGINIAANVGSNLDGLTLGGIHVTNAAAGSPTTISGNLYSHSTTTAAGYGIDVAVNGPLNITGNLDANKNSINITNASKTAATVINNGRIWTYGGVGDVNITVNANLDATSSMWPDGSVNINQNALSSATVTTLAGSIRATNGNVNINNNAGTGSNLNIDASLRADSGDVNVLSNGSLRLGVVNAPNSDINVDVFGLNMVLTGAENAGSTIDINSPNAQGKVYTSAILTAPEVYLEVLNFKGVRDNGQDYTSVSQKPVAQIVTDNLYLTAYGSVNSPLTAAANPGDWLKNSLWVAPFTPGAQVYIPISAVGGGTQAINLGVRGDAAIDSGTTLTPFFLTGYSTPSIIPPFLGSNLGSSLIVQTEGNLDIYAGDIPGFSQQFLFPGGLAFKAGGYLSINTNVNNAIASTQIYPYSGQWYEAPTIIDTGYHATNPGSRINYSTYPVTGFGTAYWLSQPSPGLYQFVNTPDARFYNVYSSAIVGGPICNVANPGPTPWPPAGC